MNAGLLSLQVGLPQTRLSELNDGQEATWTSSIAKSPVPGRLALGTLGLDGDGQADLKHHGGRDKAVCCYSAIHYPAWRALLGLDAECFSYGAFGENFTIDTLTENDLCVGDVFSIGTARVQISQPRMPCWKLGRRWDHAPLASEVIARGQTGWYLRVLEEGEVGIGDRFAFVDRPLPEWTLAHVNKAMYVDKADSDLAYTLGRLPLLAEAWRSPFRRRAGLLASRARRTAGDG